MTTNEIKARIVIIHICSILIWFLIWFNIVGFYRLNSSYLWWVPIFVFAFVESWNLFSEGFDLDNADFPNETERITLVDENGIKLITAFLVIGILPYLVSNENKFRIPPEFLLLTGINLMFIIGGILPFYWIKQKPEDKCKLAILRHIKTAFYTHSLSYTLASLIFLYFWIACIF